jgi:small subunit ribosomal protein S1
MMSESVDDSPGLPAEVSTPISAETAAEAPAEVENQAVVTTGTEGSGGGERSASGGPLSLDRIRQLRMSQQAAQSQAKRAAPTNRSTKPAGPRPQSDEQAQGGSHQADTAETTITNDAHSAPAAGAGGNAERGGRKPGRQSRTGVIHTPDPIDMRPKIAAPSPRQPLSQDMEMELNAALGMSDLDKLLVGDEMLQVGHELSEGQRLQATVMKAHGEHVFVALGGPNEGVIPALSFQTVPEVGALLEVVIRGYLAQEGLYEVTVPGNAVDVSDWSDLNEGEVIEALVTGSNAGGLECKVGNILGFIPASQAAEYRIENLADFVGQKLLCVVTEANERRGNLVLSHRAVLEREKKEKREERLSSLEPGMSVEGVVRKILDFGAFVDIGGLDGLLHVSQLSWDRVKHPSEILEEGQKIQVRIDKIDELTGKIGLSYRSLQDHPWTDIDVRFPVGSIAHGTITRIAEFGAFVRIATGVEGLIHISELAHHRVQNVANVVQEGQEVDVKILSVDTDQQRISLSLKAAQAAPEATKPQDSAETEPAVEEPRPQPVLPKHRGPLKGGTGNSSSGEQFGLKW